MADFSYNNLLLLSLAQSIQGNNYSLTSNITGLSNTNSIWGNGYASNSLTLAGLPAGLVSAPKIATQNTSGANNLSEMMGIIISFLMTNPNSTSSSSSSSSGGSSNEVDNEDAVEKFLDKLDNKWEKEKTKDGAALKALIKGLKSSEKKFMKEELTVEEQVDQLIYMYGEKVSPETRSALVFMLTMRPGNYDLIIDSLYNGLDSNLYFDLVKENKDNFLDKLDEKWDKKSTKDKDSLKSVINGLKSEDKKFWKEKLTIEERVNQLISMYGGAKPSPETKAALISLLKMDPDNYNLVIDSLYNGSVDTNVYFNLFTETKKKITDACGSDLNPDTYISMFTSGNRTIDEILDKIKNDKKAK